MENLRNKRIKERDLITDEQEDNPICNIEGWWKALVPQDAPDKIEYGHKLMVLKSIIEECEEIQDKVLVFSQSLGELNLIEHFLEKEGTAMCRSWKKKIDYCRMDGTVPPALRTTICDLFNDKDNKKLRVLLMSTKVGGLGLNLTAANRVIIMTVNWNPSYDIQSVFRVYRFGQEKEVYVYRLIALDSMEEKVYQRTVTKLAIAHRVVDKHQITRHYKSMDLQELYSCRPNADTERPMCNVPEDKLLAKLILKLPYIFKQHEHQALLANRPEDNLNEQELNAAWDEFKRIKDAPQIPPPQLVQPQSSVLPQVPLPNGPTFSMAYNLTRPTTSVSGGQKVGGKTDNGAAAVSHYFTPSETNGDLKKKPRVTYSTVKLNPKIPSGGVISLESDAAKTVQKDPLYIPLRGSNKTNKSYGELLSMLNEKQFAVPKLPQDTTIVLEGSPERDSQKENHRNKTSVKTSKIESVVILDEDSSKTDKPSLPENPRPQIGHNNTGGVKRKRHRVHTKEEILKRMKEGFNRHVGNSSSISVDDDDDIMVVPDTSSESGSLSNELITNLSRSGISIHKVIKDVSPSNGAIITLD